MFALIKPVITSIDGRCVARTKYSDAEISDPDNYKTAKYARIDGGPSNPGYFTAK